MNSNPPSWLEAHAPTFLTHTQLWGLALWQWLGLGVVTVVAGLAGYTLGGLVTAALARVARRTSVTWDNALVTAMATPARALAFLVVFQAGLPALAVENGPKALLRQLLSAVWIAVLGVFLFRIIGFAADAVDSALQRQSTDVVHQRAAHTLVTVLRRVAQVLTAVLIVALELTRFEVVRTVGVSLLASAGVAGIVVGLAAQRSISSILAGLQLAITQPIRVGDTVVVEKQFGTVEEIGITFVVIRIWDDRRLVVPIGYFLDKPFESWTRSSQQLLGTVEVPADHATPVEDVRTHLLQFCATRPEWDRRACKLHVTEATERTITLRALVSTANADDLWTLRCAVREELVRHLRVLEGGRYLPRIRSVSLPVPEGAA